MDWSSLVVGIVVATIGFCGIMISQFISSRDRKIAFADRTRNEAAIREVNLNREDQIRREVADRDERLRAELSQRWISERWWERKADTYTMLIDMLWRTLDSDSAYYLVQIGETQARELSEDEIRRQSFEWEQRRQAMRKSADVGAFVITENAASILRNYFDEVDIYFPPEDRINEVEQHISAARSCLKLLREEARRDLGVDRNELGEGEMILGDSSSEQ